MNPRAADAMRRFLTDDLPGNRSQPPEGKEAMVKTEKIEEFFDEAEYYVIDEQALMLVAARAELAVLKEENERLREVVGNGIMALLTIPQNSLGRDPAAGHYYRDELIARMKVALGQELVIKEDKIVQCRKRAVELVYGGKCDHMSGAEARQMLVDEFGEETVATLAGE